MARSVNITNISTQAVPIIYNAITSDRSTSTVPHAKAGQLSIPPGQSTEIEQSRIDTGQLEQLARLKLITFVVR